MIPTLCKQCRHYAPGAGRCTELWKSVSSQRARCASTEGDLFEPRDTAGHRLRVLLQAAADRYGEGVEGLMMRLAKGHDLTPGAFKPWLQDDYSDPIPGWLWDWTDGASQMLGLPSLHREPSE